MLPKNLTRRATLAYLGGAAAIASPVLSFGQAKPLKKVRIMVAGTNALSIGYYFLTVPTALNFWKEEGLDVEVFPAPSGGSMVAVQQLAAGGIDLAMMDVNGVMQSNTSSNGIPLLPLVTTGVIDSAVIVPENSPIKSVADLRGKSIGIINLTSGGMMLLRSLLKKTGLDMDRDVQVLPVGFGASALDALKSDRVQAMIFWGSAIVAFENLGMKFRAFRDPEWKTMPGYTLVTSQAILDKDPSTVEAVARVVAKGLTFCNASPECALKAHWRQYPDTKPTGVDDATARASPASWG